MTFCLISLDHPLNICDGLTRWTFVPLGQKLTYKISNLNNLKVCLESNQLIDVNRCNIKNQHHHHDLTRACRGGKYVCLVRIRTTDKFQSNPSTSFRINELESNKHDADKSTIKKIRLKQRAWRMFYSKQNKTPKNKILWKIIEEIFITFISLTLVQEINNRRNRCKNNESSIWSHNHMMT